MANQKVHETNQPLSYAATDLFDQGGTAAYYLGELEETLMQAGVVGIRSSDGERKAVYASSPPTLEMFPSWPMKSQRSSGEGGSSDSGSGQNTFSQVDLESPVSRRDCSTQSADHKAQHVTAAAGSTDELPKSQEKQTKMSGSTASRAGKILDAKVLRRLAQNREAARKSRMRKKAYIQQLECSKIRLQQMEHDLHRARSQGLVIGAGGGGVNKTISSGAAIFDMEYNRWLDENQKRMTELRGALHAHLPDNDLRMIIDECLSHYDDIFQLKAMAAKTDVFHLLAGMWKTPAERCFLWIGGFKPSDLLKILVPQVEPLTEHQLIGICGLQQSTQQAEEALSQGLDQLFRSLAETIGSGSLCEGNDVGSYMGNMAIAVGKLSNLEGFLRQADNMRQQTLHQMHRVLTVRQAARCFMAMGEYYNRLRALSSLWASRPRQNIIINDGSNCPASTIQISHQQPAIYHQQFSAF